MAYSCSHNTNVQGGGAKHRKTTIISICYNDLPKHTKYWFQQTHISIKVNVYNICVYMLIVYGMDII